MISCDMKWLALKSWQCSQGPCVPSSEIAGIFSVSHHVSLNGLLLPSALEIITRWAKLVCRAEIGRHLIVIENGKFIVFYWARREVLDPEEEIQEAVWKMLMGWEVPGASGSLMMKRMSFKENDSGFLQCNHVVQTRESLRVGVRAAPIRIASLSGDLRQAYFEAVQSN
ncbi:hypothetical protein HAX54_032621 [Datura stramonium]|uniref:Uncharacterized protein n=1 Tax=Datura stramonium TaxID=4076 RepID=A0ABS8VC27_DATST|nr:hypothetical protein [Datura stramonium]